MIQNNFKQRILNEMVKSPKWIMREQLWAEVGKSNYKNRREFDKEFERLYQKHKRYKSSHKEKNNGK